MVEHVLSPSHIYHERSKRFLIFLQILRADRPETQSNMANPSNTPAKLSSGGTLRFYNLLGFSKLYNFILWFITMG